MSKISPPGIRVTVRPGMISFLSKVLADCDFKTAGGCFGVHLGDTRIRRLWQSEQLVNLNSDIEEVYVYK